MKNTHPINFVEAFLTENSPGCQVQFSRYRYHPQSVMEESRSHVVPVTRLRQEYERLDKSLREDEDIAFDSVVRLRNKSEMNGHLPMLDFQTSDLRRIELASELLIAEYRVQRAVLVNSGRSYHLYMGTLLTHHEWIRFMGRVLLLNGREEPPTVDARWVGHRLIGGHSALRWSANGKPLVPEIIRELGCKPMITASTAVTPERPAP